MVATNQNEDGLQVNTENALDSGQFNEADLFNYATNTYQRWKEDPKNARELTEYSIFCQIAEEGGFDLHTDQKQIQ